MDVVSLVWGTQVRMMYQIPQRSMLVTLHGCKLSVERAIPSLSPATVSKADADRILAAGWDEDAVSFAAYVAALYGFMNRLVEGHGIKGTSEYHAMGGKRLAEIGYAGLAELLKQHA